jgi:hypothetical protein
MSAFSVHYHCEFVSPCTGEVDIAPALDITVGALMKDLYYLISRPAYSSGADRPAFATYISTIKSLEQQLRPVLCFFHYFRSVLLHWLLDLRR